jgi:ABC-type multidrug transport system permease subunit
MFRKIWAVFIARNKEFYRDRGVMAWNFLFPFLVVIGFAYAFSGRPQALYKVALWQPPGISVPEGFLQTRYIDFLTVDSLSPTIEKVRRHQIDLLVAMGERSDLPNRYWINTSSPKGYMLERILRGSVPHPETFQREAVDGQEIRYVDWLLPGILCMNMMFSSLFGVGYVIVRYRKNGMLKRLKATPLTPFQFLSAQVLSRLLLILVSFAILLTGCRLVVGYQMAGSYRNLFCLVTLGALALISLGLIVAARVRSEEVAAGFLNVMTWPMMFLSGVWFSLEGAHPWLAHVSRLLPLTHLIDGARAIMLDGASLWDIRLQVGVLAAMAATFLALGSWLFRWQ